jgi:hypothetical protein
MARIFGRNADEQTDTRSTSRTGVIERQYDDDEVRTRDDIEVVADRDPVVVREREVVPHRRLGNAAATSGLVLGVVGTLMGVVPVLFAGAMVLGFVGLIASMVGRRRATTHERRAGRKRGALGVLFSLAAIALGVVGMLIVADVINTFDDEIADATEELHDADVRLGNWFD